MMTPEEVETRIQQLEMKLEVVIELINRLLNHTEKLGKDIVEVGALLVDICSLQKGLHEPSPSRQDRKATSS